MLVVSALIAHSGCNKPSELSNCGVSLGLRYHDNYDPVGLARRLQVVVTGDEHSFEEPGGGATHFNAAGALVLIAGCVTRATRREKFMRMDDVHSCTIEELGENKGEVVWSDLALRTGMTADAINSMFAADPSLREPVMSAAELAHDCDEYTQSVKQSDQRTK